jgi:hypothetical protein
MFNKIIVTQAKKNLPKPPTVEKMQVGSLALIKQPGSTLLDTVVARIARDQLLVLQNGDVFSLSAKGINEHYYSQYEIEFLNTGDEITITVG